MNARYLRRIRKLLLLPRLASAFLAGSVVRVVRRFLALRPRIWHGMHALHMTRYMVMADRAAGFPSRSVFSGMGSHRYAIVWEHDFDVVIERKGVLDDEAHWRCLIDLLLYGDIWRAYFDCLFFPPSHKRANMWAFRVVRWAGILIVVAPHGGDIIYRTRFVGRYDVLSRKQQDYPAWDLVEFGVIARQRIEIFCRYASFVLGADSSLQRYLPRKDLVFKYFPVDCDALRPSVVSISNDEPVIIHAPNHRMVKGTDYLLEAVEHLRRAGIRCRLELIEGVPRDEALRRYERADVIADQFCDGAFGVFALEGLALGKPVLTYLDQEHLGDSVFNLPIVNTTPENLVSVLAVLIQVPTLRERLGCAGRKSVVKYQSIPALAEVWENIYDHVWWDRPLAVEGTAHFSQERVSRSFSEDPSMAEFWPVPVEDLLLNIHAAIAKLAARSEERLPVI